MKLLDVNTNAPMRIDVWAGKPGSFDTSKLSSLHLSETECGLWFGWLTSNKNWRGAASKAIAEDVGGPEDFVLIFDDYTFSRMHGVGIRPVTNEQFSVFQKIGCWKHQFMDGVSPARYRIELEKKGLVLTYVVAASVLEDVATKRQPVEICDHAS